MKSISLNTETVRSHDAIIVCTDHDLVEYKTIIENSSLIIDTKNVFKNKNLEGSNVVKA